jgi:hypothetical protein
MAIKQRSPAGGRWAGREIHQIEKMRHCESLIVGGLEDWVKLSRIGFLRLSMQLEIAVKHAWAALPVRKA